MEIWRNATGISLSGRRGQGRGFLLFKVKSMASLSLKNIKKVYPYGGRKEKKEALKEDKLMEGQEGPQLMRTEEGVVAVYDFNLEIADNEFVVLVGPSGCGKSTTLRMIAGLEEITEGELYIGDRLVNDVAPKDRNIAMVFQNYALYPHMTVYDNMAFGLSLRKEKKEVIDRKVRAAAEILDITPYLNRKPKALSGGQRQRVAIGRAIVRDPAVFLMDEPLSNLDAKLRNQMRAEIIKLRQRIKTTFVYVTHDQTEAMTLGDRIVIMKDGLIQQVGSPQEVFEHPENIFVAGFIGSPQMNFFDATLTEENGNYTLHVHNVPFHMSEGLSAKMRDAQVKTGEITLGVRPDHLMLCAPDAAEPHLAAKVEVSELMGASAHLHISVEGKEYVVVLQTYTLAEEHRGGFKIGEEVNFTFGENVIQLFDKETGLNLLP